LDIWQLPGPKSQYCPEEQLCPVTPPQVPGGGCGEGKSGWGWGEEQPFSKKKTEHIKHIIGQVKNFMKISKVIHLYICTSVHLSDAQMSLFKMFPVI
jgi:hypothetical protein